MAACLSFEADTGAVFSMMVIVSLPSDLFHGIVVFFLSFVRGVGALNTHIQRPVRIFSH